MRRLDSSEVIRNYRNYLIELAEVKYGKPHNWNRITVEQQNEFYDYIKSLRNVPQEQFPLLSDDDMSIDNITWPDRPSFL